MKRKIKTRNLRKRMLILCEDEKSSVLYFNSFKIDEKYKRLLPFVLTIIHPENYSPLGLVKNAIKLQKNSDDKYDDIWVVFDKDKHKNISQAYDLAKNNSDKVKINIAISIICFEFWILLHYIPSTKGFNKCDDLIKHIKTNHFSNYEKCSNCFDEIKDKIYGAIKNAKLVEKSVQVDLNRGKKVYQLSAYTNVHHLVSKLIPK